MIRWISVCLLLAAGGIAAVWLVAPHLNLAPLAATEPPRVSNKSGSETTQEPAPLPARPAPRAGSVASGGRAQPEVFVYTVKKDQRSAVEPVLIPNARLVIVEQQDVPCEKEGVIYFIGTDVKQGEMVPPDKKLPDAYMGFLAIPVNEKEEPLDGEEFFKPDNDSKVYRRLRETDEMRPKEVKLFRKKHVVRKLQPGDWVKRGQLLALVKADKALEDAASKVAALDAKEWERSSSEVQKVEYLRRYNNQLAINRTNPGTIPRDDLEATLLQHRKFDAEEKVKKAEIVSAQRALSASLTDLKGHEVHAAIDGVIKFINKNHQGEAVKLNEPIMQIQNPSRLRAVGALEVQEALKLKEGMTVIVEASRPESPRLVISGHHDVVNCVGVSQGKQTVIVSGSDDESLRGWDAQNGDKLWLVSGLRSPVRSLACTPPKGERNLVCFGCSDGTVRLLDLNDVNRVPRELAERHRGPVNGIAFSPNGETIATCGDDLSIRLWKTDSGELLHRLSAAHRSPITSVQFASATRLVSAGNDKRLAVWDVTAGRPPHAVGPKFEGRGGEVLTLGVSPDGRAVLFDQGKELRLLGLADKQIEGTLRNPAEATNFSTMALFSPDGKTILTNGSEPGKLQLWRTPVTQSRGSELRQFIWTRGTATCGAFAPLDGAFAVTGTQDHQVLVWSMPSKDEVESRLEARLALVDKNLDTQTRQVSVWAELQSPDWLIPGMHATMVVFPTAK